MTKQYVGDGVYVDHDGLGFILTAENGIGITNRIYLEPEVWSALKKYANETIMCDCGMCLPGQKRLT